MNTLPLELHSLLQFGIGDEGWQSFVDRYAEKYDALQIDGFDFDPMSLNYTWAQLIANTGATPLPAYVDPESPGYEMALRELQGETGNIPTMKAFYRLNRKIVQEQLQILQKFGQMALTPEMQGIFLGLFDEATDGLIKSYYNALTHQRMQIISKGGKFTINDVNNPRGLKGVVIDFKLGTGHTKTLEGTERWWTNADHTTEGSKADPVKYMKTRIKEIRRTYHYYGPLQIEMAQDLFDDLLTHSKVRAAIAANLYPLAASTDLQLAAIAHLDDDALKSTLERIVGAPIVVRDTFAYVLAPSAAERDLVETQIDNFDPKTIAFVPQGKIGSIQGVQPLTLGYKAEDVALHDGGRLVLTQRAIPETHSIYVESEAAQLCVPGTKNIFSDTVTA